MKRGGRFNFIFVAEVVLCLSSTLHHLYLSATFVLSRILTTLGFLSVLSLKLWTTFQYGLCSFIFVLLSLHCQCYVELGNFISSTLGPVERLFKKML